jgi:hypothetical protein
MKVYEPVVHPQEQRFGISSRAGLGPKTRLGVLDNTKKHAGLIGQTIARLLQEAYPGLTVDYFRKPNSSNPYTEIASLKEKCDVVINAHGD